MNMARGVNGSAPGIHDQVLLMQTTVSLQDAELLPSIGGKGVFTGADRSVVWCYFWPHHF
jgi:hypothetical protein